MIGRAASALPLAIPLALPLALAFAAAACADPPASPPAPTASAADRLAPLRAFEARRRAEADFARLPPSDRALGPDPIAIRRVPGAPFLVSALRGRDAIALLDARTLAEMGPRAPAPASPAGLAVTAYGEVLATGEASPRIARYTIADRPDRPDRALEPVGALILDGVLGLRDIAVGPEGLLYALDEREGALITAALPPPGGDRHIPPEARRDDPLCAAPFRVERLPRHLVVACLADRALVIRPVDADGHALAEGEIRIRHDGPFWGIAAAPIADGELLLAAGGVEDHPLDRTGGFFGHIDSFVYLYRVGVGVGARAERLAAINTSALGVVTPRAISITLDDTGAARVIAAAYGGAARVDLRFPPGAASPPQIDVHPAPPGIAAMAPLDDGAFAYVSPLLDAWILDRPGGALRVPVSDPGAPPRSDPSLLGEALFFTTLMAPWNTGEGPLSRFTCETCHFEGTVDGRTHSTGRGDVRATTRPLLGLFNNRPHFSRALDPDLATMVDSEFRVAGAKSGRDPWFTLTAADVPWLPDLGLGSGPFEPVALRLALMEFLIDFTHRPNPAAEARDHFDDAERAGAALFRDTCERCHAARLSADDPATAVPFDRWERLLFTPEGPIVWARDGHERTGVTPYVHQLGARPPSLRRLSRKQPYFTNGSARSLRDVLTRARRGPVGAFAHDVALTVEPPLAPVEPPLAPLQPLSDDDIDALLAFLALL